MKSKELIFTCATVMFLIAISITAGCKKDYGVELHPVKGTIKLDGQPLNGATIEFQPIAKGDVRPPRGGIGFSKEKGEYVLLFRDTRGCPAGDFRVVVSTYAEPYGDNQEGNPESIPQRYRGRNTELSATVSPDGDNVFNFDLSSDE